MSNYHNSDFDANTIGRHAPESNFTIETKQRPSRRNTPKSIHETFQALEEEMNIGGEEEYEMFDGDSIMDDYESSQLAESNISTPMSKPIERAEKSTLGGLPRIPITIGKKKTARKVSKKEHTSLQAKNSNFIFVFGYTGSGKTTVLAAIDLYIRRKYAKTVNPTGNKEGINHINKIVRNITFGEFPNATTAGTIVEYDVALTHPQTGETINLTFIEMAGEDLRRINTDDEDAGVGDLRSEIKKYLTCPDISMSFLLIADYKERVESLREDDLFMNFFGYLRNLEVPLENVGVIVSKFDKQQTGRMFLNEVVEDYLPQTKRFMENKSIVDNAKIFPFSIGEVVQEEGDEPRITAIDLRDTDAIVNWLFDSFSEFNKPASWSWKNIFGLF